MTTEPKYTPGEIVEWTNDYGVKLGRREIVAIGRTAPYVYYYLAPSDAPWAPVCEENLTRSTDQARIAPPELEQDFLNIPPRHLNMDGMRAVYRRHGMLK